MHLLNCLDSIQVIDTRIMDLIYYGDSGLFDIPSKFQHCRRDIARCDNVLFISNSRLDDSSVKSARDEADCRIMPRDFNVKGLVIVTSKK